MPRFLKFTSIHIILMLAGTIGTIGFVKEAQAEFCAADTVPARTLLIPYFEADLSTCAPTVSERTVVTVTNMSAEGTDARITFWTDWALPVFGYSISLPGYGTYRFDVRELLCTGNIPDAERAFPIPLDGAALADYRARFLGEPSTSDGLCYGSQRGNNLGVGYITIDVEESAIFPNENEFFNFDSFSNANKLVGHVHYESLVGVDALAATSPLLQKEGCRKKKKPKKKLQCRARNKFRKELTNQLGSLATSQSVGLHGAPAAHIEVQEDTFGFETPELLPVTFGVQYDKSESDEDFELIIWRDTISGTGGPAPCGEEKEGFPLEVTQIVAFDRDSNPVEVFENPAPLATQSTKGFLDNIPFDSGWIYFNFSQSDGNGGQSWVMVRKNGIVDGSSVSSFSSSCQSFIPQ